MRSPRHAAFSLLELLVVIAILALLMAILLPSLGRARDRARTVRCLANLRNIQLASTLYSESNNLFLLHAGLSHVGGTGNPAVAWINTLQPYYANALLARCPSDTSPHWSTPVPGISPPTLRRTSYGTNDFLDVDLCPWPIGGYPRSSSVPRPAATIHFLEMAQTGGFAAADHPHVENWPANPPLLAAAQLQTNAHGNPEQSWKALANYGFLDGHAETLRFEQTYTNAQRNNFDPQVAR